MHTVAHPLTPVEFDTALRTLATRAHSRYAGESARIDKGLVLALNGHITLHADGTAHVRSEKDPEVVYHVAHGRCDCPDGTRAPDGRCKHRYSVCLVKKAHKAQNTWYATYVTDTRTLLHGTATYTTHGWTFTPEGGTVIPDVTLRDLCLLGHVATAGAQYAEDAAAWEVAWMTSATWTGQQMMA